MNDIFIALTADEVEGNALIRFDIADKEDIPSDNRFPAGKPGIEGAIRESLEFCKIEKSGPIELL